MGPSSAGPLHSPPVRKVSALESLENRPAIGAVHLSFQCFAAHFATVHPPTQTMDLRLAFSLVLAAAAACVSAQHDHHNHQHHWVNVTVYYESLCPDSRKFFTQQLYPSLQTSLSNFVNLTLVPYGKTKTKFEMNEYKFDCHHGPAECQGNKIQACALMLIDQDPNSAGLGFNRVATGFINCLMDKAVRNGDEATFPTNDCALVNHVNNLNYIENCANHPDGSKHLALYGNMTDALQNPLKGVPTIVFNNQYKAEDNSLAQSNFVKALCQYIEGVKPEECSRNGAGSLSVSLASLVLSAVFSSYF